MAKRPHRQHAAFGVQVNLGTAGPAVGKLFGDRSHMPGKPGNMVFGEDRLQRAAAGQPFAVRQHEQVVARKPTELRCGGRCCALGQSVSAG